MLAKGIDTTASASGREPSLFCYFQAATGCVMIATQNGRSCLVYNNVCCLLYPFPMPLSIRNFGKSVGFIRFKCCFTLLLSHYPAGSPISSRNMQKVLILCSLYEKIPTERRRWAAKCRRAAPSATQLTATICKRGLTMALRCNQGRYGTI